MNTGGSLASSTVEINSSTENGPTLTGADRFGTSIANIGDLDGNGFDDLAVGAPNDDMDENGDPDGAINRGAVHIVFMNTNGSVKSTVEINDSTANGPTLNSSDFFGNSVENVGDLDGDGVNDLAVGASGDNAEGDNRGTIHIMFMNTDGSVKSTVEINSSTTNGPTLENADRFGIAISNIGDFDDNGITDLAIGAYQGGIGTNRGAVHIVFMQETDKPTVTITSSNGDCGDTVSLTTLSYTATFSESTSNFVVGDITVTGTANYGSVETSNFAGSGTTYTFDVVITSVGTALVSIASGVATDAAGNDNTVSNSCTFTIYTPATSSTCARHVILGNCGTIAINSDVYRIIDPLTNVPTTEVLVGQPVTVTLSTPDEPTHTKIHFASVHTEVFSLPLNHEQSAHIDYSIMNNKITYASQSQLFQIAGATHRISQDTNVKNLKLFEVVFTMVFAKPMDTSHIVVETKNAHGIPETLYLMSALKVNENPAQALTLEEKSKFSIIDPDLSMKRLGFVDPEKDPSHYVKRYITEPKYKAWFDKNYPAYTIYEAIGITFAEYQAIESKIVDPEPEMDPEPEPTKKEKKSKKKRR